MIIDYNNYFWGDSVLEELNIKYDKINITVYNNVLNKNILIECFHCAGITEIISWDENIIENIFVSKMSDSAHPMIASIKQLYGEKTYDSEKSLSGDFYELRVLLINGTDFRVICKDIIFSD